MDQQGFNDWLQQLLAMGSQYQLSDTDMANLALMMSYQNAYDQQRQFDVAQRGYDVQDKQYDYQMQHDQYGNEQDIRHNDLDLRNVDYQNRLLDFQMGPQMDFNTQQLADQLAMSHDDVLKSANYLQQQRYGTDAAKYGADVARYQAMQALGLAAPDGLSLADPRFAAVNNANQMIQPSPTHRYSALGY